MKNMKAIIIVVIAVALIGSLVYLTLLIQDGSNPLGMFGIRASNPEDEQDPFLADNNIPSDTTADPASAQENPPTPTTVALAYNSTSPTVAAGANGKGSVSPAASISPSPSPTMILTPTVFNFADEKDDSIIPLLNSTATPTTVKTLPVSGITDHIDKVLIGGGFLILLGLLL